jgi:LPXTG-motif cell wall-anchored protein
MYPDTGDESDGLAQFLGVALVLFGLPSSAS